MATTSSGSPRTTKVLIIGGGFTGLTAARELAKAGIDCILLEGSADHLGGRAYGYPIRPTANPTTLHYDHGAEYVGDLQTEIMGIIQELSPGALVNGAAMRHPYPEEIIVLAGKRYTHPVTDSLFGITGVPPTISIWDVLGLLALLQEIVGTEQQINVVEPWNSPAELQALDQITLADWFSRDWISPIARDLVSISIEALLSVEAKAVSPFYLFWYTACNNGFLYEINDNEGGAQQYWLSTAMSELAERYAAPIVSRIHKGVLAHSIDATKSDKVHVLASDGHEYVADRVIVAMAPHTASRIQYKPALPPQRKALMSAPMGRTLKCQVFYRSAWWRNSNGTAYGGWAGGASFPIVWVMDNSPLVPSGANVLMTFTVGAEADKLGPHPSKAAVTKLITETLCFLFNDMRALSTSSEFIELVMFDWSESSFIGGGPNTIMTPGMLTGPDCPARIMDEPWLDRVFFMSAETARKLTPISKLPTWDPSASENLPQYDENGNRRTSPAPPYQSKYSDMRQSLGYMDGAIVAGQWVAAKAGASLSTATATSTSTANATATATATPTSTSTATPTSTGLDPSAALPPISPGDTLAILNDICSAIQGGTAVDLAGWMKQDWSSNSDALQGWLTTVVVTALATHGQIQDPTDPMQVLLAIENFTRYGLRYSNADASKASPADQPTLTAIRNLTGVASALMQAKSAEPFVVPPPGGSAATPSGALAARLPDPSMPARPGPRLAALLNTFLKK